MRSSRIDRILAIIDAVLDPPDGDLAPAMVHVGAVPVGSGIRTLPARPAVGTSRVGW